MLTISLFYDNSFTLIYINYTLRLLVAYALVAKSFDSYTQEALVDQITHLPGLNNAINFKQFSGYLKITETKSFHYWMVESLGNVSTDPVAFVTERGMSIHSEKL